MIGRTGSGKTAFLLGLLNEMDFENNNNNKLFKLKINGSMAYVA